MLAEYVTEPYAKAIKLSRLASLKSYFTALHQSVETLLPVYRPRVHTGLTADCTKLDVLIDCTIQILLMTSPAFGGNIMATIVCKNHGPQMATVRPGVMQALAKDETRTS